MANTDRKAGPVILDSDETTQSFTAILDVNYKPFVRELKQRDEFVHHIGHRGYTDAKFSSDFGVVDVLFARSDSQTANPDRDFDDYFTSTNSDTTPTKPAYTSATMLHRDVSHTNSTKSQAQSACLVFLADVARAIR